MSPTPVDVPELCALTRGDAYALAGALLLCPPGPRLLEALAVGRAPDHEAEAADPCADSWRALCEAASRVDVAQAKREFDALFVAVGDPPLDPRAARYLAPAQADPARVALRRDMRRHGLALADDAPCDETHLGALCECARLLLQRDDDDAAWAAFFGRHIAPWYGGCLTDIAARDDAPFYRAVGGWARGFLDGEHRVCNEC